MYLAEELVKQSPGNYHDLEEHAKSHVFTKDAFEYLLVLVNVQMMHDKEEVFFDRAGRLRVGMSHDD